MGGILWQIGLTLGLLLNATSTTLIMQDSIAIYMIYIFNQIWQVVEALKCKKIT